MDSACSDEMGGGDFSLTRLFIRLFKSDVSGPASTGTRGSPGYRRSGLVQVTSVSTKLHPKLKGLRSFESRQRFMHPDDGDRPIESLGSIGDIGGSTRLAWSWR